MKLNASSVAEHPAPKLVYELAPLRALCEVDEAAPDRLTITIIVSYERLTVPNLGDLDMVVDEVSGHGFCITVGAGDRTEMVDLEDAFKRSIFIDHEGDMACRRGVLAGNRRALFLPPYPMSTSARPRS